MMIGGAIIGAFPLVAIGFVIGIIGMIYAKYQLMMLEEKHYEAESKEFGEKLDGYLNNEKNDSKNKEICKALDDVTELIEQENPLDVVEYGTNESANRILTTENIGKIFKCLKSEDKEVKNSAANLIRAALIQDLISKEVKVVILTSLAKMAKNGNNNNNINNNGILEKYLGKDALNSLKALELPNKESVKTKQDKNHKQSQIKEKDLSEIIKNIKNHTPVNQGTKNKK
jgi:hypothetical protein